MHFGMEFLQSDKPCTDPFYPQIPFTAPRLVQSVKYTLSIQRLDCPAVIGEPFGKKAGEKLVKC
jgi:hypothetical protein